MTVGRERETNCSLSGFAPSIHRDLVSMWTLSLYHHLTLPSTETCRCKTLAKMTNVVFLGKMVSIDSGRAKLVPPFGATRIKTHFFAFRASLIAVHIWLLL